jgi:Uma2 family endonuclease
MEVLELAPKKSKSKIPEHLIYEMVDGRPVYYAGYQNVVKGIINSEAIMGSSIIQSYILRVIQKYLDRHPIEKEIVCLGNEIGFKMQHKSWRNCDLAIYKKERLKNIDLFDDHYIEIPPNVIIEVDTKADLRDYINEDHYYREKTQQLLDFGVEKVIWIYTKQPRKVMIAENGKDWILRNWNRDFEIMPNCNLNLQELIEKQ